MIDSCTKSLYMKEYLVKAKVACTGRNERSAFTPLAFWGPREGFFLID